MPYGLKYQTQFTSQSDPNNASLDYTLKFRFKDYVGEVASLIGAETSVIQKCTIDDPFAPVKGQSLSISILNKGNSIPITAFQSDDDDGVQVELSQGTNILFIGFLVQDDFYESKVDYTHAIQLSANDSLGLLKGVVLSEASVRRCYPNAEFQTNGVDTVVYVYVIDPAFYPQAGDTLELQGVSYTVSAAVNEDTVISSVGYNWTITLTTSTGGISPVEEDIYLTGEINLLNKNSLLSIIAVCLGQTNLSLLTNIYFNLYEYRQDNTRSTFEQTLLDSQLFIKGDSYMDCYAVLEMIMKTFKCSLFQANGQWNIVHWYDAVPKESWSYANNAIPGFVYDETWNYLSTTVFDNNFFVADDVNGQPRPPTIYQAGFTEGALRGYKFTKRQFDYKQPKYLLRNYDLQTLGALLRQYVSGTSTIYEYVATDWTEAWNTPVAERFIRVEKSTADGTELSRALVVRGATGDSARAVQGVPFEITEGDKVKFSFTVQTNYGIAGPSTIIFAVRLTDGTLNRYVNELPVDNGDWQSTLGFNYSITSGDNFNSKHSVEIQSSQAPFSGLVYCYLSQPDPGTPSTSRETYYTDIRLEYQPYIADAVLISGQIHSQTRATGPKLFSEDTVHIDDSPRNSIEGTLFNTTKTGLLQDRTTYWRYPPDANGWRLGELTTLEELIWRQKTRSKFEGGFIGNYQQAVISLLTMAITDFYPNKNYIFGLLTIDYKRNQFSGTLWELYDLTDGVLDADYLLKYLYSTT